MNVRLLGFVHEGLTEYADDHDAETLSDALDMLIPDTPDQLTHPENESVNVHTKYDVYQRIKRKAGDNVSMSYLVRYYLDNEGYIHE